MSAPKICMIGSSNIDLIARVPRIPAAGETLFGTHFQLGFGGKGANQAVMAARLGAQVRAVTKVGRDIFGDDTERNYRTNGIDTEFVLRDDTRASGVALINVDDNTGQNSIVVVPGANDALSPADVHTCKAAILASDVLICQLEIPLATILEAFRIAKNEASHIVTILNPAPAAPLPEPLIALTDVLIPNEIEAAMLTGLPSKTPAEAEAAARDLQRRGVRDVVITLGDRGAMLIEGLNAPQYIPAEKVKAVDSTGAGDAFVGSLAYFLGEKRPLIEAVRRAVAIATLSVLKIGTQTSFPYREEVAHLLE